VKDPALNCRKCGHWMGRSRVRDAHIRCGKCRTEYQVRLVQKKKRARFSPPKAWARVAAAAEKARRTCEEILAEIDHEQKLRVYEAHLRAAGLRLEQN
jgi:hypothetical protein